MKIQQIKEYQYILNSDEMATVVKALQYAKHRIIKHPTCGAGTMSLENIEKLLRDFDENFNF